MIKTHLMLILVILITPVYAESAPFTNPNIDNWIYPNYYESTYPNYYIPYSVTSLDMLLMRYGLYDEWYIGDFNHDFELDSRDMNILLKYNGHCKPSVHIYEDSGFYKVNHTQLHRWYNFWCVVKEEFIVHRECNLEVVGLGTVARPLPVERETGTKGERTRVGLDQVVPHGGGQ